MKIRKVTAETLPKVLALLRSAFPGSSYEVSLVEKLHKNEKDIKDWALIHTGKVIGYLALTNAYKDNDICGLHLAPVAVKPEYQNRGLGSELVEFALRKKYVNNCNVYVLGNPGFYTRFGFDSCRNPSCPFDRDKQNFLVRGKEPAEKYIIGYEREFLL